MLPKTLLATALLAALVGCASPAKPTEPDDRTRRPANTGEAIDLQVCRSQLSETRIQLSETARLAEVSEAALAELQVEVARRQGVVDARSHVAAASAGQTSASGMPRPNVIWTLRFAFNSARIDAAPADLKRLTDAATAAALVVVKGRTDGSRESMGESQVARLRADAMRHVLVQAGVDPKRIDVQYQPIGDYLVPNTTDEGRATNRRVEVELYSVMPDRRLIEARPIVAGVRANPM
jgi:outer membrane protein OmpA-like peptidoglycan-associated protein